MTLATLSRSRQATDLLNVYYIIQADPPRHTNRSGRSLEPTILSVRSRVPADYVIAN